MEGNKSLILAFSLFLFSVSWCRGQDRNWYKTTTLYEIYPKTFRDANNDGIGDIPGILQKFDLFTDAGITALWMTNMFEYTQDDAGYEVTDYYTIDPDYGTNDDLKELIERAHASGIKILLDFVPNHTSDQHKWFQKSEAKETGYEDFYVWVDPKKDENGDNHPPNNWLSILEGSAWEWSEKRQQYYLHQFTVHQPDLNFRDPNVLKALQDVLIFWLDFGVYGFQIDAVPYLLEDEQLRDEPLLSESECNHTQYSCLDHIYTKHQNGSFQIVYGARSLVDNYTATIGGDTRIIITEAYADRDTTLLYYGSRDGSTLGAHYTFNFDFISYLNFDSKPSDLVEIINWWQDNLNRTWIKNWVLGNHDHHRVASRIGYPDAYNMLVIGFLPGASVTYQGEEIAMVDGDVQCTEGQDPQASCSNFEEMSKDFERTPYQWDFSEYAGFDDGAKPWLPVSKSYLSNNLAAQNVSELKSHYNLYKDCVKFHKKLAAEASKVNYEENTLPAETQGDVLIAYRLLNLECDHPAPYIFLFNMNRTSNQVANLSIKGVEQYAVEVTWLQSRYMVGKNISASDVSKGIILFPQESIILKAQCSSNSRTF